jgi:hypothetical protein
MLISERVADCLRAFQDLSTAIAEVNQTQATKYASTLPLFPDEFGRFKVWSGNIGAHRLGRGSLDYRLRDASHLKTRFVDLLNDLHDSLTDGTSSVSGNSFVDINTTHP